VKDVVADVLPSVADSSPTAGAEAPQSTSSPAGVPASAADAQS